MARKKPLQLSDIQDEADIYDRLVFRQRKVKRKLNSAGKPALLADQVERVDANRNGRYEVANSQEKSGKPTENAPTSDEELPVVVESVQLQQERRVESIPNVQAACADMIRRYDELLLHKIFQNSQDDCMFRLFVSAASFGQLHLLNFPQDTHNLYVSVLRDIVTKQTVKESMSERFVTKEFYLPNDDEHEEKLQDVGPKMDSIVRTVTKITVPKRILRQIEDL